MILPSLAEADGFLLESILLKERYVEATKKMLYTYKQFQTVVKRGLAVIALPMLRRFHEVHLTSKTVQMETLSQTKNFKLKT